MRRSRKLLLGLILCGVVLAATFWISQIVAPKVVREMRPVRATANWPYRVFEKMTATQVDLGTVDRIEVSALDARNLRLGPHGPGSSRLSDTQSPDSRIELGRIYRLNHAEKLFPSDPKSQPLHTVLASRMVEQEEARKLLTVLRAQAIDCDPEGTVLCHSPNFSLGLYVGQKQVVEISLCWFCQTVDFYADGQSTECELAVNTDAARMLRRTLKGYFPTFRTEEELAPKIDFGW